MLRSAPLPNHLLPLPGLALGSHATNAFMRVVGDTTPVSVGHGEDNTPRPMPTELKGVVVKPRVMRVVNTKGNHIFTPVGYVSPARKEKKPKKRKGAFLSADLVAQLLAELKA